MMSIRKFTLCLVISTLVISACNPSTSNQQAQVDKEENAEPVPEFADVIFHNGNLVTMADQHPAAQAIAINDDMILAVGSDQDMLAYASDQTITVDLEGKTMFPGFIESHSHRITQRGKWGYSFEEATMNAARQGWTTLDELYVRQEEFEEMIAAAKDGQLFVRVNAFLSVNGFAGETYDDWYHDYDPGEQFGDNLRAAALKIFIDFDSGRTLLWEQDDLNAYVRDRQDEGWQVAVKAVGQNSHDLALNAYEYAMAGEPGEKFRYRVEHSVAANDAQIQRMAEDVVIASIQPAWPAQLWFEEDILNLGQEEGMETMFRWRDYLANGVVLAGSTYNPPNPENWEGYLEFQDDSHMSVPGVLYRNQTQRGYQYTPSEEWMKLAILPMDELLKALTINGAFAVFEEDVKGSLEPGKLADLVVLSDDPRDVEAEDLLEIEVLLTMVGGQAVFCSVAFGDVCAPSIPGPDADFSWAAGSWKAIDNDGSSMRLALTEEADGTYSLVYEDEVGRLCEDAADKSVIARGAGEAVDMELIIQGAEAKCNSVDRSITFDIRFNYNAEQDKLSDDTGVTWERE